MRGVRSVALAGALLLWGCEGAATFQADEGDGSGGDGAGGYVSEGGGSQLTPTVWGRVARRLSVAQLRATFPIVLGNDAAGRGHSSVDRGWWIGIRRRGRRDAVDRVPFVAAARVRVCCSE